MAETINVATLDEIQEKFDIALQVDLEHGVKWMNEEASAKFAKEYPTVLNALGWLSDLDKVMND